MWTEVWKVGWVEVRSEWMGEYMENVSVDTLSFEIENLMLLFSLVNRVKIWRLEVQIDLDHGDLLVLLGMI